MRADVLKEKSEMKKIWDYWHYNLKGKGCPPPTPYIMDWEKISSNRDFNENWTKSWTIIGICIIILMIEFILIFSTIILK
jgi:hypothetical protein